MSKNRLLGAAAAFAFVASGVVAQAQDGEGPQGKPQERGAENRPAKPRARTGEGERAMDAPEAAQGERPEHDGAARQDAARAQTPGDAEAAEVD